MTEGDPLQQLLNLLWAPLSGFVIWVSKALMDRPSRLEIRQLIDDKQKDLYTMQAIMKEDLHDINKKLDTILDRVTKN